MKNLKKLLYIILTTYITCTDSPILNFADYYKSNPLVYSTFMAGTGYLLGSNSNKKKLRVLNQSVNNTKLELIGIKPRIKNTINDLDRKIVRVQNAMDKMEADFNQRVTQIASTARLIDSDLPGNKREILRGLRKVIERGESRER